MSQTSSLSYDHGKHHASSLWLENAEHQASGSSNDHQRPNTQASVSWQQMEQSWQNLMHQQLTCWAHASIGATSPDPAHIANVAQGARRRPFNRKGLRERLRQKKKKTLQSLHKDGSDVLTGDTSSSEGHKVWETSEVSEEPQHVEQDLHGVHCAEKLVGQEACAALQQQLRQRDSRIEEVEQQLGEVSQRLQYATACAEAAKDDADSAWHASECHKAYAAEVDGRAHVISLQVSELENMLEVKQHRISELEFANSMQIAHTSSLHRKIGELEEQLVEQITQMARNVKLQEKVQELAAKLQATEIENGAQVVEIEKLTERVCQLEKAWQASEIESGSGIARNAQLQGKLEALEAKLHSSEIESGGGIARNVKLQGRVHTLTAQLHVAEIESGSQIARNAKLSEKVHQLEGNWCLTDFDSDTCAGPGVETWWMPMAPADEALYTS